MSSFRPKKIVYSFWILVFALSFSTFKVASAEETSASNANVEKSSEDSLSCPDLKIQKEDSCRQAAGRCVEVHRYDALNQIRSCAYYAQRCYDFVEKEGRCRRSSHRFSP